MRALLAVVLILVAVAAPAADAADPGRWLRSRADAVPLQYFQGLTHDPGRRIYFAGLFEGLYRTDVALREQARNGRAIPADVKAATGFNHIGDPTWDAAEGGRVLLPLECFDPLRGNTCGRCAIGVADPNTLAWRYLVPLDPVDIAKAMWAEVSPDGQLLWTSSGPDLLAYRTTDVVATAAAPIRPARRVARAVPPSGVTGAAFHDGRLFLAGQSAGPLQVWSVDVDRGGRPRLEIQLDGVRGESEGLDVLAARGGLLHWLISPFARDGLPTFGLGHSELLSFVPRADGRLRVRVTPERLLAGRRQTVTARVWLTLAGRRHPIAGARVRAPGGPARGVRTDARGTAQLALRPRAPGRLRVTAAKDDLLPARAEVRVLPGR